MPEIPDLEAMRHYLQPRLRDQPIDHVEAPIPWLVRTGADDLQSLVGLRFVDILRHGKFLLFNVEDGRVLVINAMLTGRFHWVAATEKHPPRLGVVLGFGPRELRYSDMRRMGRFYLVAADDLAAVPQFSRLGPDVMSLDHEQFAERIRRRSGQIKNTLTNQEFVSGIGNAYSDEILWEAGLHPHRRRSTMTNHDIERLYLAVHAVIDRSSRVVGEIVEREGLGRKEEWRQHLLVHRRTDEPCPRCGAALRSQKRSGSETNYCLQCQPLFA